MTHDDVVALASTLISIPSVNPDLADGAAGESGIADFCAAWLAGHGFEVHRLEGTPGRPSVVGVAPGSGGGRSLMLNGHLDTVGVRDYAGEPFTPVERDGKLCGRGAFDMKGGLAAILVSAARARGRGLRGDVVVALVADEEFGSIGTEEVLARFRTDAAIVAEPSELELVLAHRGFAWFELEITGRAAHGSMPEQGIDAIAHAGLVLRALDALGERMEAQPRHPLLGHGTVRVATISGGVDAATVAPSCTLTIERRTLPGETPHAIEAELRAVIDSVPGIAARLRRIVARAAFEADRTEPIVEAVFGAARAELGREPGTRGEPFWTDAGLYQEAGIPTVLIGVDGGGAHATEEWASTESIRQLARILEESIVQHCA